MRRVNEVKIPKEDCESLGDDIRDLKEHDVTPLPWYKVSISLGLTGTRTLCKRIGVLFLGT